MRTANKIMTSLAVGDAFLAVCALQTVSFFDAAHPINMLANIWDGFRTGIFILLVLFFSFLAELYSNRKAFNVNWEKLFFTIPLCLLSAFIVLSFLYYFIPVAIFARRAVIFSLCIFGVYQFSWHILLKSLLKYLGMTQKVLILGSGALAKKIGEIITLSKHNYILAGYYELENYSSGRAAGPAGIKPENLSELTKREKINKLVVSVTERRGIPLQEILNCKLAGIEVVDAPAFYEELMGKLLVENITPSSFIFSEGFKLNSGRKRYKRIADIILSLLGLCCTLPFFPLVALIIKIDSKGPVFFSQIRVGEGEKPFSLYKFRTMKQDAEKGSGAVWAQVNDSRITQLGKILRKIRIDEFPQFYNVLKGDMSFIGPRPERPEFVERLKAIIPYYSERHCVKPGITGWAQIMYPYGASEEDSLEKLRYDLFYIKNLSFAIDGIIILETIKVMLFGKGAR